MKIFDLIEAPKDIADLPDHPFPYYIAAKQSLYIRKTGPLGTALLPTEEMPPTLNAFPKDAEKGLFTYKAAKLPADVMGSTIAFFKAIHKKHSAEAEVIILWNSATKQYTLFCPYQRVSAASVHSLYDPTTIPAGHQAIGTIHSHCDMSAFHSGTDTNDASSFPGLHITIGDLGRATGPTFAAMVMFNGVRFDYDIERVAEPATDADFPKIWTERVITGTEQARAKVIAEQMQNVSEEDKRKFLQQGYSPSFWNGDYGHSWGMKPFKSTSTWTKRDDTKPKQIHASAMRWSTELKVNVEAQLLDNKGEFLGPDEAIEAISMLMDRVKGAAANYDIDFDWELSDMRSGQLIMWSMTDEEGPEVVVMPDGTTLTEGDL